MAKTVIHWYMFVTVLLLAKSEWSLCNSTEAPMEQTHLQFKSRAASVQLNFDSSLESAALERLMGRPSSRFNLEAAGASSIAAQLSGNENSKIEVEVLLAFKNGITRDPFRVLNSWQANDSDPCSWQGVECTNLSSVHVTGLKLGGFRLEGKISASFGELPFLQSLDLSENWLQGSIPASLANCSNLLHLNMSSNQMSGYIPAVVGQLQNLQDLDLSRNNFTGEIPTSIGRCSSLRILDLRHTFLSGSLPSSLGNCSRLETLRFSYTNLGGELPGQLGQLVHLREFSATACLFDGNFPMWILNTTSMQHLDLFFNQISGQIPEALGQFLNLIYLHLGDNSLTGGIPRSIVNMTSLQVLDLLENKLTGPIPHDVGLLRNLTSLQLFNNALSGLIPSSLSNCSLLEYLHLGVNLFEPQVFPPWIATLRNLIGTFLAQTNLQGAIPEEIGQLSQLYDFGVYTNNLTGAIPPSLGNCTALFNLDVSENQLTGEIPSELGLLANIGSLLVGTNFFSAGPFPAFFYNLTTLTILELEGLQFNGKLDGDFGRLQQLNDFRASQNNFEGPFPESFVNCSQLATFYLDTNNFSGGIPHGLANLSYLQDFRLAHNHFTGNIPVDVVKNFKLLQYLDLSDNSLGGTIPEDIGYVVYLQYLWMYGNNFVGVLPDSLVNCTQLLILDVSYNRLNGSIPGAAFAVMSSLTTLSLSHNLLSGSWPAQFSGLKQIQVIDVSTNNISGPIPAGLGGCLLLVTLDLSFNQLTGAIPQDLGRLTHLATFNASYNNFSGPIPDTGAFKANLTAASFLGNPGLCGGVLGAQRQCPVLAPALGPSSSTERLHCRGFKCAGVWIPVAATLGTVIVLIGVSFAIFRSFRSYPKKVDDVQSQLVLYSVDPRIKFKDTDILAAIAAGEENVIGVGATSIVYKAVSPGGVTVAIKVVRNVRDADARNQNEGRKRWEMDFANEAHTLGLLRHRNIINVLCFFGNLDVKAIVSEYMPNGSLHAHLHCRDGLTWAQRFKILLGVTHGMLYLHHEFPDPIIHRDLKPTNILLCQDMEPKICDFGISKFVTTAHGEATASGVCGTFGYIAPEYGTGTRLSTKGDVYSFGVVLLELLTAKEIPQTDGTTSLSQTDRTTQSITGGLVTTVQQSFQRSETGPVELLDPTLQNECAADPNIREQMMLTLRVGLHCTKLLPQNRPSMEIVLEMLMVVEKLGQEPVTERTLDDLLRDDDNPASDALTTPDRGIPSILE